MITWEQHHSVLSRVILCLRQKPVPSYRAVVFQNGNAKLLTPTPFITDIVHVLRENAYRIIMALPTQLLIHEAFHWGRSVARVSEHQK